MSRHNRKSHNTPLFTSPTAPRTWEITYNSMDQIAFIYNNLDFGATILLIINLLVVNSKADEDCSINIKNLFSLIGLMLIVYSLGRRLSSRTATPTHEYKINRCTTIIVKTSGQLTEPPHVRMCLPLLTLVNLSSGICTTFHPRIIDRISVLVNAIFAIGGAAWLLRHSNKNVLWLPPLVSKRIAEVNQILGKDLFKVFKQCADDVVLLVKIQPLVLDMNGKDEKIATSTISTALEQTCLGLGIQCIPTDGEIFIVTLSYNDEHFQTKLLQISDCLWLNLKRFHQIKQDAQYVNKYFSRLKTHIAADINDSPCLLINRKGGKYQQKAFDYISQCTETLKIEMYTDEKEIYLEISSPINNILWKEAGAAFSQMWKQSETIVSEETKGATKSVLPFIAEPSAPKAEKTKTRSDIPALPSTSLNLELKTAAISWLLPYTDAGGSSRQHEICYSAHQAGNVVPYKGCNHHLSGSYFLWDISEQDDNLTELEYKRAYKDIMVEQTCDIVHIYVVNDFLIVKARLNHSDNRIAGIRHPLAPPKLIHWVQVIDHSTKLNKNFALRVIQTANKKIAALSTAAITLASASSPKSETVYFP